MHMKKAMITTENWQVEFDRTFLTIDGSQLIGTDSMRTYIKAFINTLLTAKDRERAAERERCTDLIAAYCSFAMENSKSQEIRNFASSLANRLNSVINNPTK